MHLNGFLVDRPSEEPAEHGPVRAKSLVGMQVNGDLSFRAESFNLMTPVPFTVPPPTNALSPSLSLRRAHWGNAYDR
jgi:hypothetical protein